MKVLTETLQIRVSKSMLEKIDLHARTRKLKISAIVRAMLWMSVLYPEGLDKVIAMLDDLEMGAR